MEPNHQVQLSSAQKFTEKLASKGPQPKPVVKEPANGKPHLTPRARGWLKHVFTKATTPDDWTSGGKPHEWWDSRSGPPMTNYQRFDLHESSYSLAIMADVTPAWREIYSVTLDELVRRYTSHWAAVDWNNMFGKDPDVGNYPEFWKGRVVPAHNFREYHTPGWVSNGHQHSLYKETTGIEENCHLAAPTNPGGGPGAAMCYQLALGAGLRKQLAPAGDPPALFSGLRSPLRSCVPQAA